MNEPNTRNGICQERTDLYWEGREKVETAARFWNHGPSHRTYGMCAEVRAAEIKAVNLNRASDFPRKVNS
jgi:hypothetical protein